ncbi:hypothetical protein Ac2012v2_003258 [Leucoagaricus gongylophorus]
MSDHQLHPSPFFLLSDQTSQKLQTLKVMPFFQMYSSIAHLGFDLFESLSESHSEQNLNCGSWQILTKPWESGGATTVH